MADTAVDLDALGLPGLSSAPSTDRIEVGARGAAEGTRQRPTGISPDEALRRAQGAEPAAYQPPRADIYRAPEPISPPSWRAPTAEPPAALPMPPPTGAGPQFGNAPVPPPASATGQPAAVLTDVTNPAPERGGFRQQPQDTQAALGPTASDLAQQSQPASRPGPATQPNYAQRSAAVNPETLGYPANVPPPPVTYSQPPPRTAGATVSPTTIAPPAITAGAINPETLATPDRQQPVQVPSALPPAIEMGGKQAQPQSYDVVPGGPMIAGAPPASMAPSGAPPSQAPAPAPAPAPPQPGPSAPAAPAAAPTPGQGPGTAPATVAAPGALVTGGGPAVPATVAAPAGPAVPAPAAASAGGGNVGWPVKSRTPFSIQSDSEHHPTRSYNVDTRNIPQVPVPTVIPASSAVNQRMAANGLDRAIEEGAAAFGNSPDYMKRIAEIESNGNLYAHNQDGTALGAFQIEQAAWKDGVTMAKQSGLFRPDYQPSIFNARDNAIVANAYVSILQGKFHNDVTTAIAYDWGPHNAQKWLDAGADPARLPQETRDYVAKMFGVDPNSMSRATFYQGNTTHNFNTQAAVAAATQGPGPTLQYIAANKGAATLTEGWDGFKQHGIEAALANGRPDLAEQWATHVNHIMQQGVSTHLQQGLALLQAGDMQGAALQLQTAHAYFGDGRMSSYALDPQGNLYAQMISENTGKPMGSPIPVTAEGIKGEIAAMQDPKEFLAYQAEEKKAAMQHDVDESIITKNQAETQMDIAHGEYYSTRNQTQIAVAAEKERGVQERAQLELQNKLTEQAQKDADQRERDRIRAEQTSPAAREKASTDIGSWLETNYPMTDEANNPVPGAMAARADAHDYAAQIWAFNAPQMSSATAGSIGMKLRMNLAKPVQRKDGTWFAQDLRDGRELGNIPATIVPPAQAQTAVQSANQGTSPGANPTQ